MPVTLVPVVTFKGFDAETRLLDPLYGTFDPIRDAQQPPNGIVRLFRDSSGILIFGVNVKGEVIYVYLKNGTLFPSIPTPAPYDGNWWMGMRPEFFRYIVTNPEIVHFTTGKGYVAIRLPSLPLFRLLGGTVDELEVYSREPIIEVLPKPREN